MPVALLPYEAVAFAGICKALRGSNLQTRMPSYQMPSFWSRPIYKTNYVPIPNNTDWTDLVAYSGTPQYLGIIKQYACTTLGDLATSGLLFRMMFNGQPMANVALAAGVEINKDGPNTYPLVLRNIFLPVNETQRVSIQVKNPTGVQAIAMGVLCGWAMQAVDSTITSDSNAVTEGIDRAVVGVDSGDY
jgi:hypothetical protein